MEYYLLGCIDWDYNDEIYSASDGIFPQGLYVKRDQADERCRQLNRERFREVVQSDELNAYLGESIDSYTGNDNESYKELTDIVREGLNQPSLASEALDFLAKLPGYISPHYWFEPDTPSADFAIDKLPGHTVDTLLDFFDLTFYEVIPVQTVESEPTCSGE